MIVTVNTTLFYVCLSRYLSWFKNKDPEYAAYINSTINATLLICTEQIDIGTRMSLFGGYLISDTIYLLCKKTPFHPKNQQFFIHHLFSLALTTSTYPLIYPEITGNLLLVERTIPIANALWFLKHYNLKPTQNVKQITKSLKVLFFTAFTYYRVIYLSFMSYTCYQMSIAMPVQLCVYSICAINMMWYKKLLKMICPPQ
jgi:hypothetical protein